VQLRKREGQNEGGKMDGGSKRRSAVVWRRGQKSEPNQRSVHGTKGDCVEWERISVFGAPWGTIARLLTEDGSWCKHIHAHTDA